MIFTSSDCRISAKIVRIREYAAVYGSYDFIYIGGQWHQGERMAGFDWRGGVSGLVGDRDLPGFLAYILYFAPYDAKVMSVLASFQWWGGQPGLLLHYLCWGNDTTVIGRETPILG